MAALYVANCEPRRHLYHQPDPRICNVFRQSRYRMNRGRSCTPSSYFRFRILVHYSRRHHNENVYVVSQCVDSRNGSCWLRNAVPYSSVTTIPLVMYTFPSMMTIHKIFTKTK